jgi:RNA recognition motif-containing protein
MNIYVGNISRDASDSDLRAAFEAHGEVSSAKIIMDRVTGQSRGFAFVEMPSADAGKAAITALNGQDHMGRKLTVNEARPREDRPRGGGGGGGGRDRDRDRGPRRERRDY